MQIVVNSQVEENRWNDLLANGLNASPFQTQEFYCFLNSVEGFSADVFAIETENTYKSLVVVSIQQEKGIKTYFSRRGIIYGGPLLMDKEQENSVEELIKYLVEFYKRKLIYLEIRNYSDFNDFKNIFIHADWAYLPWSNFQKDISSVDIAKKSVSSSRMRQIKKALKSGVEWRAAKNEEEVLAFYEILQVLYSEKVKKPLFPFSFFKAFFESRLGLFLLVFFENKVIGGIMCPILPNKAIYEFYVCGLDSEYKEQYPSVMATWAAIEYGLQNNIPLFDFMGAGMVGKDYGVRDFKARFGGELVEHGRFLKVLNPSLYSIGKLGLKILSIATR